eukprot:2882737-Prymnesium_polylepis.2
MQLHRAGFELVRWCDKGEPRVASERRPARLTHPVEWWAAGRLRCARPGFAMDLDTVEAAMDPRDRGLFPPDPERKRMRSFLPIERGGVDWDASGLPPSVIEFMRDGVTIRPEVEPPPFEHPFYPWKSGDPPWFQGQISRCTGEGAPGGLGWRNGCRCTGAQRGEAEKRLVYRVTGLPALSSPRQESN